MSDDVRYRTMDSPVGTLTLAGNGGRLRHLRMTDQTYEPDRSGWLRDDEAFGDAVTQLEEYFRGERQHFELSLDMVGTAFQRRVWEALMTIPYGETRSYGEIARQIEQIDQLARAVMHQAEQMTVMHVEAMSGTPD